MKILKKLSAIILVCVFLCPQCRMYAEERNGHRELIVSMGLLNLFEDGDFRPDSYVTNKELSSAVKLMSGGNDILEYLKESGRAEEAAEAENAVYSMTRLLGYPEENYRQYASDSGILKGVALSERYIKRDVFEKLVYNTLVAERIQITRFDGEKPVYEKKGTLLKDVFGIIKVEGIVEADFSAYVNVLPKGNLAKGEMLIGDVVARGTYNTKEYLARHVEAYVKTDEKSDNEGTLIAIEKTKNEEIKKTSEVIDGATTSKKLVWYDKEKDERKQKVIPSDAVVIYNGKRMGEARGQEWSLFTPGDGEVNLVDNNSDGNVDAVIIWNYNLYNVDYVNSEKEMILCRDFSYGSKIELEGKNYFVYDENGKAMQLSDIKPFNVLCVTELTEENIYIACSRKEPVEGRYKRDGYSIYVGNDKYSIGNSGLYNFLSFSDGDMVRVYLDIYGRTAYIVGKSEYEYAFLDRVYYENQEDEPMYIKLYTEDGRICRKELAAHVNMTENGSKTLYSKNKTGANSYQVLAGLISGRRELIKYKENKLGKVNEIVFAKSKIGQDLPDTTRGFEIYYADNSGGTMSFKEAKYLQNTFVSRYRVTKNTFLFSVEENVREPEKFRRLSMSDLSGDSDYRVMIYDVNDRFEAGAVVFEKYTDWYSKQGSIVTEVSKEAGADGEILTKLKLYTGGEEKTVYANNLDISVNPDIAWRFGNGSFKLSDVKVGDIIYYKLGTDGYISGIAYLHKNISGQTYYHKSNYGWGDIYIPNCAMAVIYCPVKSIYDDMFVIYSDGSMPIAVNSNRRYYICENNKIRKAEYSDIAPGDNMVGMWKWSSLVDVVVYK